MDENMRRILPLRLLEIIDRAGVATVRQILTLSMWDLKKKTNLHEEDIQLLKSTVSDFISPKSSTCKELLERRPFRNISSGSSEINYILHGGFRTGTITEIFGESGSGKTQLAIQTCVHNYPNCSVYICTEDIFPVKRFEDMKKNMTNFDPNIDYGQNLFVEHITEVKDLLICLRIRLPKLLSQIKCSLVVLDSVAAPFRVEDTNYVERADELREVAFLLLNAAQQFNLAIICINQVTGSNDSPVDVQPCLGLAWSNMISTRLCMKKLSTSDPFCTNSLLRNISVTYAPNLPNDDINFIITKNGIQAVDK